MVLSKIIGLLLLIIISGCSKSGGNKREDAVSTGNPVNVDISPIVLPPRLESKEDNIQESFLDGKVINTKIHIGKNEIQITSIGYQSKYRSNRKDILVSEFSKIEINGSAPAYFYRRSNIDMIGISRDVWTLYKDGDIRKINQTIERLQGVSSDQFLEALRQSDSFKKEFLEFHVDSKSWIASLEHDYKMQTLRCREHPIWEKISKQHPSVLGNRYVHVLGTFYLDFILNKSTTVFEYDLYNDKIIGIPFERISIGPKQLRDIPKNKVAYTGKGPLSDFDPVGVVHPPVSTQTYAFFRSCSQIYSSISGYKIDNNKKYAHNFPTYSLDLENKFRHRILSQIQNVRFEHEKYRSISSITIDLGTIPALENLSAAEADYLKKNKNDIYSIEEFLK